MQTNFFITKYEESFALRLLDFFTHLKEQNIPQHSDENEEENFQLEVIMKEKKCQDCRRLFKRPASETWRTLCSYCYVKAKGVIVECSTE